MKLDLDFQLRRPSRRGETGFELALNLAITAPVTGIIGPSGAGKSTLLDVIAGLTVPDRGRVVLDGAVLFDSASRHFVRPHRRRIGVVFQEPRLLPHLSVVGNLKFGMPRDERRERGRERGRERERIGQILDMLELGVLANRMPNSLSGGEQRRVAIGRALLMQPKLLLLDEPLTGLDAPRRRRILADLARVRDELGVPMIVVSHHIAEFLSLGRHAISLANGRAVASGDLFALLRQPDDRRHMAAAIGRDNLLELAEIVRESDGLIRARLVGNEDAAVMLPALPSGVESARAVWLRPEDVLLANGPIAGISARNALSGRIVQIVPDPTAPGSLVVTVDVGQLIDAEINARAVAELHLTPNAPITCLIKTSSFSWQALHA